MSQKFNLPSRFEPGEFSNLSVYELLIRLENHQTDADFINPLNLPTICGYNIPKWQRPLVWTLDQKISLIQSIWRGIPIGSYSTTHWETKNPALRNLVVDGQQRLNAIEGYFRNEFSVFGAKWVEIDKLNQRRFTSANFPRYVVRSEDPQYLKNYYNLLNFAGSQHTQANRLA